jgi:hypothetical protein
MDLPFRPDDDGDDDETQKAYEDFDSEKKTLLRLNPPFPVVVGEVAVVADAYYLVMGHSCCCLLQ